ncbi:Acetamidase/Formamidase [Tuber magnatum]|uniref:Acetamidase/Formamidase n=1 Tax=Tuber magnatum TaxID=42249 RepID=A0A317T1K7_9PEZI|nr:Acetamidase/Formamidase [Tuber magnatum]
MGTGPIRTALKVDFSKSAQEQPYFHARFNSLMAFDGITPGEVAKVECVDCSGGWIRNDDYADDARDCDLTQPHYLSGPFEIEGADPGDVLAVETQDVQPFEDRPWGFTAVFDRNNGGGFLDDHYPQAAKAIWNFEGIFCSSRHIPHVRFPGLIHPGVMGCAPSAQVLVEWNRRESELVAMNTLDRVVTLLPEPRNVHAGSAPDDLRAIIGRDGARTIPGRPEHGGNCDIKNLGRGSRTYLPVHVPGANFSISFCGAIEMAGIITLKFELMKGGVQELDMKSPIFTPGPVEPHFGPGRMLTFEGFSVDEAGRQHFMDATVSYKQTCLRAIEYLKRFGCSGEQIYLLLSCVPVQGHVAGIVDIPNACTTMGIPMDIFDFDISPGAPIPNLDMGSCAYTSDRR